MTNLKPPSGTRTLLAGLILKPKRDANGSLVRFKVPLVVCGNFQDYNAFDTYLELYAPVVCIEIVRPLPTVDNQKGWKIPQIDFQDSSLHAIEPNGSNV